MTHNQRQDDNHPAARRGASALLLLSVAAVLAACSDTTTTPATPTVPNVVARTSAGGNALNAKSCQKNGWQGLVTSSGAPFTGQGACVSYGAQGGTLYQVQSITFAALAGKTFGNADFAVSATASSGLPVSFSASGDCNVNLTGTTVHLVAAGSCTITAHQPGDATWFAAPDVARSFAIAKGNQTITFAALGGKTFGDADFDVSATATSGLTVDFTASGNCTIAVTTVHLTGVGSCTITAKQGGNTSWNPAADVPRTFAIAKGSQTVSFTSTNPTPVNVGATYTPTAAATPSGLGVTITLDGTSGGCSLALGVVSFNTPGTCVINANQAGNSNYYPATQVQQSITSTVPCIGSDASLRAAAAAGGAHNFCAGANIVLTSGAVAVGTTLSLTGMGGTNAVVNANALSRVFDVTGNLTLRDVTVTGGASTVGGGISINTGAGVVTLNGNSSVTGNRACSGGGVAVAPSFSGGQLIMNDAATVSNNQATPNCDGGGVALNQSGSLIMNGNSAISGNVVSANGRGAGMRINGGTVQMNDNAAVAGNVGATLGGGVYFVNGGSLVLTGTAHISGNSAADGGGIYRIDNGGGSFTGVTSLNVVSNAPNNCASSALSPPVPGCVN